MGSPPVFHSKYCARPSSNSAKEANGRKQSFSFSEEALFLHSKSFFCLQLHQFRSQNTHSQQGASDVLT